MNFSSTEMSKTFFISLVQELKRKTADLVIDDLKGKEMLKSKWEILLHVARSISFCVILALNSSNFCLTRKAVDDPAFNGVRKDTVRDVIY